MDSTVLIFTAIVISILILINLLIYGAKSRAESVIDQIKSELENTGEKIISKDTSANFFGIKSLGGGQIRGNGFFVLTDKRILFVRYFPRKQISIPLETIKNTETVKTYLGKSIFAPLLKINFDEDEVAFYIEDASKWAAEIDKARQ